MSRIGNKEITIPKGVTVELKDNCVCVAGPKGELSEDVHESINVRISGDNIQVGRSSDSGSVIAFHGLTRSLIYNMIVGVTEGYEKKLEIVGVGYKATMNGKNLDMALGFSHPVKIKAPEGIGFVLETPQKITVRGISKQLVGQVAADIKKLRKPEPYKGKGVRYAGEHILRKAGKSAK